MHRKIDVEWVWDHCPGCQEPMVSAPGPTVDFIIRDERIDPPFRILRGWRCGFVIFGTVWQEGANLQKGAEKIEPRHGHVYLTNILSRTIETIAEIRSDGRILVEDTGYKAGYEAGQEALRNALADPRTGRISE